MSEIDARMEHAMIEGHGVPALYARDERARWARQARFLAWLGVSWHGVEAAMAVGAGLVAGSVALR
jgi:hypothetical protein